MGHLQTAIAQAARASAAGAARHHLLNAPIIQEKALRFYRDVLGFQPKMDVPMGEHRWLTLVSPDEPDGVQLLLEPDAHPAAKPFKAALMADGIPCTSFAVEDVGAEHARLLGLGVVFTQPPVAMGPVTTAVFDDTSDNLVQIAQQH